jgi:hypothetical protein
MFLLLFFLSTILTTIEVPLEQIIQKEIVVSLEQENIELSANGGKTTETTEITTIAGESQPTAPAVEQQASITITNAIDQSMLPYKHWTGTYTPDVFTVQINGTEIAQGAQYTLAHTQDPIEISFDYSFMNGTRKGSKKVSYTLNENSTDATITFSWKDTHKLILSNATPIQEAKA